MAETYGLPDERETTEAEAPVLAYRPAETGRYRPGIALIGCGGITRTHLTAYKKAGYSVVALCDCDPTKARERQREFYPNAKVYDDYRKVLGRTDVEVVDIATHPEVRYRMMADAIAAGKHVLSQKPFVLDLDAGERLVEMAAAKGVRVAVNQNARWAPHYSYVREAVAAGLVGEVTGIHASVHWDHEWIVGTPFDDVHHVVLYDFAIHWFDMVTSLMPGRPARKVMATLTRAAGQKAKPPLLGQVLIEYDGAHASLVFDAATKYGPLDETYVTGTRGTIRSQGPSLTEQRVTLFTDAGRARPVLEGSWFPDGFHGTMAELLCAVEEGREPSNGAGGNLESLAVCFAAVRAAETGTGQVPGKVRKLAAQ